MKTIECDSETGITLALIEGIIAQSRVLKTRDLSSDDVREALQDLEESIGLKLE